MASMQQTYEDFKPLMEEKDTPDALLLLVHVPGFTKEQVGASFEVDSRTLRVFGEKPVDNNKRRRFKEKYVVPETCDCDQLKAKFDGTVVTFTMPKKPISSVTPKESKIVQEAAKQVTPPRSTSDVEAEGALKKDEKGVSQEQIKSEMESESESDKKKDETQTPPEATNGKSEKPQMDKEIPQNGTSEVEAERALKKDEKGVSQEQIKSEMESESESDKKKDETQTPPEATNGKSEKPQMDREIPQNGTSEVEAERALKKDEKGVSQEQIKSEMESESESDKTKDETQTPPEATNGKSEKPQMDKEIPQNGSVKKEEKHSDQETKDFSTPEKAERESRISQKDQEGTSQKGKLDNEKKHEESKKAEKERIQEYKKKTSEAGKEPQKVQTLAKEAKKDKGSFGMKTPEERKKKKDFETGKVSQRNDVTEESELPKAKGIKNIANSASQAVTRLADRFKVEDKQKLVYAGAAILIVAVGIYASFKLRSQGRQ